MNYDVSYPSKIGLDTALLTLLSFVPLLSMSEMDHRASTRVMDKM